MTSADPVAGIREALAQILSGRLGEAGDAFRLGRGEITPILDAIWPLVSSVVAERDRLEFELHEARADLDNEREFRAVEVQGLPEELARSAADNQKLEAMRNGFADRFLDLTAERDAALESVVRLSAVLNQVAALADEIHETAASGLESWKLTKDDYGLGRCQAFDSAARLLRIILKSAGFPSPLSVSSPTPKEGNDEH